MAYSAVSHALEAGYRHINSAVMYRNEAACWQATRDFIGDTKVSLEEISFTSKIYGVAPELDYEVRSGKLRELWKMLD